MCRCERSNVCIATEMKRSIVNAMLISDNDKIYIKNLALTSRGIPQTKAEVIVISVNVNFYCLLFFAHNTSTIII